MHIACWLTWATDTYSEYEQGASVLRYNVLPVLFCSGSNVVMTLNDINLKLRLQAHEEQIYTVAFFLQVVYVALMMGVFTVPKQVAI
jgi:hypothetical protein